MINQSRRDFLKATTAAAFTAALGKDGWSSRAFAQQTGPIPASEWDYRTTKELVEALQGRKISAIELTDHVIARIEAVDPQINAVVVRDFDRARDGAKIADAALSRGERRALLGIPMVVKESFNVAGLPTTWGIPTFKDWTPKEDAVAVTRLKSAGAVILGKTNVPLVLGDWQSYNDIYGTTNNPWDAGRAPGQVALLRRLRPVLGRYRLARISGALCAPRRTIAEFAPTSRRLVSCLFAAQARRVPRLSRVRAILLSPDRWQGARLTSH
jgi:amidase